MEILGSCVLQETDVPVDAQPRFRRPGRHLPSVQARAPSPQLPHLTWRCSSGAPSPHGRPLRRPPLSPQEWFSPDWTEAAGAPCSSQLPHSFLPRSQALLRALLPPTCQTEPVSVTPGVSHTVTYRCPHPQKTVRANEPAPGLGHCPPPHCTLTG